MNGQNPDEEAAKTPVKEESVFYKWFVVILLMCTFACAFVDRQILNLLAPGIQRDYHLTDVQMSLLLGPSFAILFGITGFWFGRVADRSKRIRLIRYGVTAWSILTTVCGIAPSFPWLFVARIGVGVGEATISPSGVSLISDLFPTTKRARPLAIFSMGSNMGASASYLVGAAIIPAAPVVLPLLGLRAPWQAAFIYVGLPGLILAALGLLVREPVRREKLSARSPIAAGFLKSRAWVLVTLLGGAIMLGTVGYGTAAWLPAFFVRVHGWSTSRIGVAVGLIILCAGISATFSASWMVAYLRGQGRVDATLRTMLIGAALIVVPSICAWQAENAVVTLALYGMQFFTMAFATCLVSTAICDIAPNEWRATLYSIYLLAATLFGLGLGPTVIALISRQFFAGNLGDALSTFAAVVTSVALISWMIGLKHFRHAALIGRSWQDPAQSPARV